VIALSKNIENNLLNPRRLKIIIVIIIILLFGLVLDFISPISVKDTDIDAQNTNREYGVQ